MYGFKAAGRWRDARGANLLDGAAPFYGVYPCADGRFVAVGALEPQFYEALLSGLGLEAAALPDRWNPKNWPALRAILEAEFAKAPARRMGGAVRQDRRLRDAGPVDGRGAGASAQRVPQNLRPGAPARSPRQRQGFRATPRDRGPPATAGAESEAILREYGFSDERIAGLRRAGAL